METLANLESFRFSAADEGFEVGEGFHEINFKRSLKVIPVFHG